MNIRIDITISKEYDEEDVEEFFGGSYENIREMELEEITSLLKPYLKEGYKIVMNSVVERL